MAAWGIEGVLASPLSFKGGDVTRNGRESEEKGVSGTMYITRIPGRGQVTRGGRRVKRRVKRLRCHAAGWRSDFF